MTTPEYDEDLIKQYLKNISAEGVKALRGENVNLEVERIVQEAAQHFSAARTSTETGNLKRFSGLLTLFSYTTHESQPQVKQTYDYAKRIVEGILEKNTP